MDNRIKIGISPLLWSNDDFIDIGDHITLENCLQDMSDLNFAGCEIGSKFPTDTHELAVLSDKYHLQFCNQWFSLNLLTQDYKKVEEHFRLHLQKLMQLNAKVVAVAEVSYSTHGNIESCPFLNKPTLKSTKDWDRLTHGLNQLGKVAQEYGISLCYHHHLGTIINTKAEIDYLMDHTMSDVVYLTFDTGHLLMADEDPHEVWDNHASRVKHIHIKNVIKEIFQKALQHQWSFKEAILNGIFTVPGDQTGDLNTEKFINQIKSSGYEGWLIIEAELDPVQSNSKKMAHEAKQYLLQLLNDGTSINYLCAGHACHDLTPYGYTLGGTVSYASTIATSFGRTVGVITCYSEDFLFNNAFESQGISLYVKKSRSTTIFENIYTPTGRTQYLRGVAEPITDHDIPSKLKSVEVVHFGLIADEIDFTVLSAFPQSLKAATIQGWLRQWNEEGFVTAKSIDWTKLSPLDIIIYSVEDINGIDNPTSILADLIPIVILTKGKEGVDAYHNGTLSHHPAYPTREIDPTGAGDVFSTAFIIKYAETKNLNLAIAFGQIASSIIIERKGSHPIPSLSEIEQRLTIYRDLLTPDLNWDDN